MMEYWYVRKKAPPGRARPSGEQRVSAIPAHDIKTDGDGKPDALVVPVSSYLTRKIKRHRRTKAEIGEIRDGLKRILQADNPMTVRQVFYRAVVAGLVEKTELEYQCTVARLLLEMRRDGQIPYSWIADSTRWMRKPRTYTGLAQFIETHQRAYRRDLWAEADTYCETWVEKEALAGVLLEVTAEFDVPLMVSRGFASESYLFSAADSITDHLSAKTDFGTGYKDRAYVYYFGDFDPAGLKISASIEAGLRRLCARVMRGFEQDWLVFERVAVNENQIAALDLPSRPTKTGSTHAKGWPDGRPSVELDAIPSHQLRGMVRSCIERHVSMHDLRQIRTVEAAEREQLRIFGQQIEMGGRA